MGTKDEADTSVVVPALLSDAAPTRRPTTARGVDRPTPAPKYTVQTKAEGIPHRIRDGTVRIRFIPIDTPFQDIAVHVPQAPGIRGITADFTRLPHVFAEVRLFFVQRIPEMKRRRRPGPASVLPLRLRRQRKLKAGGSNAHVVQLLDIFLRIIPRHPLHRQFDAFEITRIIPHNTLPHPLRYLRFKHPKTAG